MLPTTDVQKSRAITCEEFDRLIAAVLKVVDNPEEQPQWELLLRDLWWSGLRLSEALALRWDDGSVSIESGSERPLLRFKGSGQKSGKTEDVPAAPEFVELLASIPVDGRSGHVFKLPTRDLSNVRRTVTANGKAACVVTSTEKSKWASAHDLRRSFCTRWATRVMPQVLKVIARHANISTTLAYYVGQATDEMLQAVWNATLSAESSAILPESTTEEIETVDVSRY